MLTDREIRIEMYERIEKEKKQRLRNGRDGKRSRDWGIEETTKEINKY